MEKEFCSFKLSKKLKSIGFNKQCLAFYNAWKILTPIDTDFISFRGLTQSHTPAPLIQQVTDWLFSEKKLYIEVAVNVNVITSRIRGFQYYIYDYSGYVTQRKNSIIRNTPTEATLAAIEECVDKLMENINEENN